MQLTHIAPPDEFPSTRFDGFHFGLIYIICEVRPVAQNTYRCFKPGPLSGPVRLG